VFTQGDPSDAIFYIQKGAVKLSVVSRVGKEATLSVLGGGDFFGEACLAGQSLRSGTATALSDCSIMRLTKEELVLVLHVQPSLIEMLLAYVLARNIRIEEDLVDHLFNSSEKRLARVLLLLANFGKDCQPEPVIPKMSQQALAEIVGTTRPRISFFMKRFKELGYIAYKDGLHVSSSLLNVILHD
jgi:CRP-like cAMP-binding protein